MAKDNTKREIIVFLTLKECEILKNICMEVLGNHRWKTSRERALVLNKLLDSIERIIK